MKRTFPILLVAAIVVAALGPAAGARTSAARTTGSVRPTIVLVHGAWADGSSWNRVTRRLQSDRYTVDVPANPLRGLASDSAYLASFLHTISGPIVLVGHSYGGAVITNAALGDSQVKALVYVDAYIPREGENLVGLTHAPSCFAVQDLTTVFNFVLFPGAPPKVFDSYVKPSVFPGCFANGLPAKTGALLAAEQRPLATNALFEPSGPPAWASIPSWDVIGTADRVIPAADQRTMAGHANARVTEIDAPHLSMISDPQAVTKVITDAANAGS